MAARRGTPRIADDLVGGEFVRLDAGFFRITNAKRGGEWWAILLRPDLTETGKLMYLAPNTRVRAVLPPPEPRRAVGGEEADPLMRVLEDA